MKYFKYLASLPIVLSVLAATYGAINYTSKLTNQIDASTILYALRDGSYKLASQAEYQALEELVRNNSEAIRDMGYDIKEIERVASGGY